MAIENAYEPDRYMGDGTQTVFPVSFAFHDVSWLRVTLTSGGADVPLANGTDFTGAIAPGGVGGSVTLAAAPANGATVTVWMDVPRTQPAVLPSTGHFDLKGLERMLDRTTLQIQQLAEGVARAVKTAVTSTTTPDQIMTDINAARTAAQAAAADASASEAAAGSSAEAALASAASAAESSAFALNSRTLAEAARDVTQGIVDQAQQEVFASAAFVPIGAILDFPVSTVPVGFLICGGQTVTREAYPSLVAYLTGDPLAISATLPDLRGEFRRGADLGRGVDAGRAVGSAQGDAMREYIIGVSSSGQRKLASYSANISGSSSYELPRLSASLESSATDFKLCAPGTTDPLPTAAEFRPRNVAVVACIKAYHAPMSANPIDLSDALAQLDALALAHSPDVGKFCVIFSTDAGTQSLSAGVATQAAGASALGAGSQDWRSGSSVFQMTAPATGVFRLIGCLGPASGSGTWSLELRVNGVAVAVGYSPSIGQIAVDHVQSLNTGDIVTLYVTCSVAAALRRTGGCTRFSMERVK